MTTQEPGKSDTSIYPTAISRYKWKQPVVYTISITWNPRVLNRQYRSRGMVTGTNGLWRDESGWGEVHYLKQLTGKIPIGKRKNLDLISKGTR